MRETFCVWRSWRSNAVTPCSALRAAPVRRRWRTPSKGSVRIAFESESVALRPGEAALLASDRQFVITAFGRKPARLLMVIRTADVEPIDEIT